MAEKWSDIQNWSLDRWLAVIGIVIGVVFAIVTAVATVVYPDQIKALYLWTLEHALPTASIIFVSWAAAIAIWVVKSREVAKLKKEQEDSQQQINTLQTEKIALAETCKTLEKDRIPYVPEFQHSRRWNNRTEIIYGHVEFEPFLKRDGGDPVGLGIDLLSKLLNPSNTSNKIDIRPSLQRGHWNDIISRLVKADYDVVATPLFATFDRSRQVRFTAPLFFSNIGLYVSAEYQRTNTVFQTMTVESMKRDLRERAGDLKFLTIEGEISQKLAAKYVDPQLILPPLAEAIPKELIEKVANIKQNYALFCDSFYAHHLPAVRLGRVTNVLRQNQILYPVCFAVRIGDYQLANLLNIRILQLTQQESALNLLAEQLKKDPKYEPYVHELKNHYVDQWSVDHQEVTHA